MPPEDPADSTGKFGYWHDAIFLASSILYLINRFFIKPHMHRGEFFFRGHFNDFLLVPAVLPLFLYTYRFLGLRVHDNPPTWREVLFHLVMWSFFFEVFGPDCLHHGTSDPWDALMYAAGAVIAGLLWNRVRTPAPADSQCPARS